MYCADTNWIIWYLEQGGNFEDNTSPIIISRISYIELLSYANLNDEEVKELSEEVNKLFFIIELDPQIATLAATLRRQNKIIRLGDAIILATAMTNNANLLTFDKQMEREYNRLTN